MRRYLEQPLRLTAVTRDDPDIGVTGLVAKRAPEEYPRLVVRPPRYRTSDLLVAGKFRSIVTDPNGIFPECVYEGTIQGTRLVPMPY